MTTKSVRKAVQVAAVGLFAVASFAMAQDNTTATNGWKRVGDPQVQSTASNTPSPSVSQSNPNGDSPYPDANYPQQQTGQSPSYPAPQGYPAPPPQQQYPQTQQGQQQYPMQAPPQQQQGGYNSGYNNGPVPSQITVPTGTYVTVRVNQQLRSDRNQVGDGFSATLVRPLVANGVVVAEPGQTIGGRVAQVQKSGRIEGLSKLGVELTDLTLVDGQQMPLRTTLVSRTGNSSVGRDAAGIAATTGLGAAIGAAADWGRGAAIGAGAGAAAGIIGVLVTRGEPSVIYPEQVLTFRIEQPLTVSTEHSPQAFRYVQPGEYSEASYNPPPPSPAYGAPGPGYAASPYYAPYPYYGYSGYPYYGGFSIFVGPGWGRGYYYGGGHRGGFAYRGFRR
jgi:hypothetical protein